MHRFSVEIVAISLLGISVPEMMYLDYLVKIIIGLATLFVVLEKYRYERKKRKHEDHKNRSGRNRSDKKI